MIGRNVGLMEDMISKKAAIDLFPDDDLECDTKGGYIAPHLARQMISELPSAQPEMIREIRKWINSGNRGSADYFIVEKIEELINKYE